MHDNSLKTQAFKLKGRLYTLTVISVEQANLSQLNKQLVDVVSQAPKLLKHSPVVIDLTVIAGEPVQLTQICEIIRKNELIPVAVQGGNSKVETLARCEGLAVLNASTHYDKSIEISQKPKKLPPKDRKTKVITTPVRSGQQIVSSGDLIVVSSVSHGAELLAEGHIHVYGTLRGRALAGISGDGTARIFCQKLEAELISIAGYYSLSDAFEQTGQQSQVFLQDEQIKITQL